MNEPATAPPLRVVDYDPNWPQLFRQIKDVLSPWICDVAIGIQHVGGTSIPRVAAKPIIDVDIVIAARSDLPLLISRLEKLGYQHRGDLGVKDRDAFRAPENLPAHHLYACVRGSLALQNHLAVRDYLQTHPEEVAAYSSLKKRLAEQFPRERERPSGAKPSLSYLS